MSFGNEYVELVEMMTYRNGDIREAVGYIWSSEEMCQLYRQDNGAGALGESLRGSQEFTMQWGKKSEQAKAQVVLAAGAVHSQGPAPGAGFSESKRCLSHTRR